MRQIKSTLSQTLILFIVLTMNSMCLTNGPLLPEYTNFEPLETTDMVNLNTGKFTYTIPVINVPGPGLGFPVVLNYHSNILAKQEATWVGLGWNIQAGAINRQVDKMPDDYNGQSVHEAINSKTIHGWQASISYNGATVGVSYHSSDGYGGMVGYSAGVGVGNGMGVNVGVTAGWNGVYEGVGVSAGIGISSFNENSSSGDVGASAGLSIGANNKGGKSAGLSAGLSMKGANSVTDESTSASLSSVGVSLVDGAGSMGILGNSVGSINNFGAQGNVISNSTNISIPVPTPWGIFTLGYGEWNYHVEGYGKDKYYGFLFSDPKSMNCDGFDQNGNKQDCYDRGTSIGHKVEYAAFKDNWNGNNSRLMRSSQDAYMIHSQGVSGTFKPFKKDDGDYFTYLEPKKHDFDNGCGRASKLLGYECKDVHKFSASEYVENTIGMNYHENKIADPSKEDEIFWRFLNDNSGSEYADERDINIEGDVLSIYKGYRSQKIEPVYSVNEFFVKQLVGFIILQPNGVKYTYTIPLITHMEVKESLLNGDDDYRSHQRIPSYASTWLLTSIQSPDYVKMNINECDKGSFLEGFLSENPAHKTLNSSSLCLPVDGDVGGWIRFSYGVRTDDFSGRPNSRMWTSSYSRGSEHHEDGTHPNDYSPTGDGANYQRAWGVSDLLYLTKIESPTHKALFKLSEREDAQTTGVYKVKLYNEDFIFNTELGLVKVIGLDAWKGKEIEFHIQGRTILDNIKRTAIVNDKGIAFLQFTPEIILATRWDGDGVTFSSPYISTKLKKLDQIVLKEKSTNQEIDVVNFNYDYSLAKYTPNGAEAHEYGRLTLKSVQKGASTLGPFVSPYRFFYNNNRFFQSAEATTISGAMETGRWDRWGYYCSSCYDNRENSKFTHEADGSANQWNLEKILKPSGVEIAIQYEVNTYKHNSEEFFRRDSVIISHMEDKGIYNPDTERLVKLSWPRIISGNLSSWGSIVPPTVSSFIYKYKVKQKICDPVTRTNEDGEVEIIYPCNMIPIDSWLLRAAQDELEGWNNISNDDLDDFVDPKPVIVGDVFELDWDAENIVYGVIKQHSNGFYAGGSRVKRLSIIDPISKTENKITYEYEDGVIGQLPSTYSDYDDKPVNAGTGVGAYLGGSEVSYGKVTTTMSSGNSNYKSVYHFITPVELPLDIKSDFKKDGVVPYKDTEIDKDLEKFKIEINDYSAFYGMMWKKEDFEISEDPIENTRPVRSIEYSWGHNTFRSNTDNPFLNELPQVESNEDGIGKSKFGITQFVSSHIHINNQCKDEVAETIKNCITGEGPLFPNNIFKTQVIHRKYNPYLIETKTTQDGLVNVNKFDNYDFKTAVALKSTTTNSGGETKEEEIVPAYWKYPQMEDKNMLTQIFSTTTSLSENGTTKVVGSQVNTWRPVLTEIENGELNTTIKESVSNNVDYVFRKQATYNWRGFENGVSQVFKPFSDECIYINSNNNSYDLNVECSSTNLPDYVPNGWIFSGKTTQYDHYGNTLEYKQTNGVYNSSHYNEISNLPISYVANARFSDSYANNFEEDGSLDSWNGFSNNRLGLSSDFSYGGLTSLHMEKLDASISAKTCKPISGLTPDVYSASVWYFDYAGINYIIPGISVSQTSDANCRVSVQANDTKLPKSMVPQGEKIWKRMSLEIDLESCQTDGNSDHPKINGIELCLHSKVTTSNQGIYFDELRFHPKKAFMKTYQYDYRGQMVSTVDGAELLSTYHYDAYNNLTSMKDFEGNILSEQFKQQGR